MKGIVLAAGRGSRLGAHTQDQPKCLLPLAGHTLLDWQLAALREAGMEQIGLVTGYKAESLAGRADRQFFNPDWAQTNMVASLMMADPWLSQTACLVSYSDIVYHPQIIRDLAASEGSIVIGYDRLWESLWRLRFVDPFSDAESFLCDETERLIEVGRKNPTPDKVQGQYMGLLKIEPEGWKSLSAVYRELKNPKLDATGLLKEFLVRGGEIFTCPIRGRWCEVDNENDWNCYQEKLNETGWTHDWRWGWP